MPLTLVLLPGLDGTGLLFSPLLAALPADIKAIIVGYPGDRQLSYHELLPLILDALPTSESFILVGESFSGPLAVMAASRLPAGLIGVVLCATFVTSPWPLIGPFIQCVARPLPFRLYLPYKRIKAWFGSRATSQHRPLLSEMRRRIQPAVIASRVRMVFRVDVRDELGRCAVPLLYLEGSSDVLVPKRNLRIIQRINPTTRVARIKSSHMILQRHPGEAVEHILRFIRSLKPAS